MSLYTVSIDEGFDMDLFSPNPTPGPTYWRGVIRRGKQAVARTDRYQTREDAEREADLLLRQFKP